MIVSHLQLSDFRNYATADLPLSAGPVVFVGRNGHGKTNLVESVNYLGTLSSHRTNVDSAMIRQGRDSAVIRARMAHGERSFLIEVELNRSGANRCRVNGSDTPLRQVPRYVSSVLFAPEDLALVRGEPAVRRRYLDQLVVQRTPRIAGVLSDYDRVLKQRNTLLKSARAVGAKKADLTTLDVWDDRLVELGSTIVDERSRLLDDLHQPVADAYRAVAGDDHHPRLAREWTIREASGTEPGDMPTADAFRTALEKVRGAEIERGLTLVGPHRDEMPLILNGLPAKGYASHGESWSFALALRLGSAQLLRQESAGGDPVLILDDVFAELDAGRRERLAERVHDYEQVLITGAVAEDIPQELSRRTVRIRSGEVVDG